MDLLTMNRIAGACTVALQLIALPVASQQPRRPEPDRQALIALEHEWLEAKDSATLDRILAPDFVHPVPSGDFLTKAQHIHWFVTHPRPTSRRVLFERLEARLYGDVGIATGVVVATDERGGTTDRTMFTDVFVRRYERWQAVNAQENAVRTLP